MALSPIRLLLVDDHDILRYGLRALLRQHPEVAVVGEADSVAEAVRQAAGLSPDVVLMDGRLPDGHGIDACRDILSANPAIRVLFFSAYSDEQTVMATLLAGASGHVSKDLELSSLVKAIREVAQGGTVVDAKIRDDVLTMIAGASRKLRSESPAVEKLSPQEERVMELVVEGKTNKEIAAQLGLSDKTIKNYLRNAFQKLGVGRRAQAASIFDVERVRARLGTLQEGLADERGGTHGEGQ